jgi:hypothetical protein
MHRIRSIPSKTTEKSDAPPNLGGPLFSHLCRIYNRENPGTPTVLDRIRSCRAIAVCPEFVAVVTIRQNRVNDFCLDYLNTAIFDNILTRRPIIYKSWSSTVTFKFKDKTAMTTHPTPLSSQSVYALSSLTEIFTAALERKQDSVNDFNRKNPDASWAAHWPQGNCKAETMVVEWLKAQAQSGATQIITKDPISSADSHCKNSLYLQIMSQRAHAA